MVEKDSDLTISQAIKMISNCAIQSIENDLILGFLSCTSSRQELFHIACGITNSAGCSSTQIVIVQADSAFSARTTLCRAILTTVSIADSTNTTDCAYCPIDFYFGCSEIDLSTRTSTSTTTFTGSRNGVIAIVTVRYNRTIDRNRRG